ncbi:MAG: glycosyltransferase family 2 protein [Nitriliruptoraceae bacterium]
MPAPTSATPPTVLAVLVAHDGAAWLPRALDALASQTHAGLEILAVDNASEDGSRELLLERLGEEHVLVADRDLGFGGAVSMALDARPAAEAPYVLTVHDDLELAPDAVAELVAAMEAGPRLAVVGPKLLDWTEPDELQSVGFTIDTTGRADSGVDVGELDQGQRDQEGRTLYVSTAGMLVRRAVFDELGRFDRRFHVFRDDLDLCWRAWSAGHDVEVVPSATGCHVAGAANYLRLGQTRFIGPRYFAERNTLAALLKNYGPARLAAIVPLYILVGLAKTLGFLLTRRFSDAWQTVRAWLWNLTHLLETRRYRRAVQERRIRSDRELSELFGRISPRIQAYVEAMASWVAGGDVDPAPEPAHTDAPPPEPHSATGRAIDLVRRRPVLASGGALALLAAVGTWPLLRAGQLRGGELAPWPETAGVFFTDHLASWHEAAAFGTAATPSPAQGLLGLLQFVVGNSAYLAPRVLLLAPLVVAWLLALRAAQTYSDRRLPRVIAATAYVLSPPALAALVTGRIGALVVLAVLPGLVAGGITAVRRNVSPARAWRAVAAVILLGAVGGAFEPALLVALAGVSTVVAVVAIARAGDLSWRTSIASRAVVATLGPLALLAPWSFGLLAADGPLLGGSPATEQAAGELWAWLLMSPSLTGFPGWLAGIGFVLAGLLGLAFGWRRNAGLVTVLWVAALSGAVGGWWLDRGASSIWAGTPLLVTAAAFAGAFALAFATGARQLARYAFGWRQIAAAVTGVGVTVSILTVAWSVVREPFDAYAVDEPALPSFVRSEAATEGPFRVLVLAVEGAEVVWEVVDGAGATMAAYGVPPERTAERRVEDVVADLLTRRDPGAADRLGQLGVRYVIVPATAGDEELTEALLGQEGLEPEPAADGELLSVSAWLPKAAVVAASDLTVLDQRGALPADTEVGALTRRAPGEYRGSVAAPGAVLLAAVSDDDWLLSVDGEEIRPEAGTPVRFTDVPAGDATLHHDGGTARTIALTTQLLLVLLVFSLALRPPGRVARKTVTGPDHEEVER